MLPMALNTDKPNIDNSNVILTSGTIIGSWADNCIRVIPIYNNVYPDKSVVEFQSEVIFTSEGQLEADEDPGIATANSSCSIPDEITSKKKSIKVGLKNSVSEPRLLGPDCGCLLKCFEKIGPVTLNTIFTDFWALSDYNAQNAYLFGLITTRGVKRRYTKADVSRRNITVSYCVKKEGQNIIVCKKAFLNVHGLQCNRGRVYNLVAKIKRGQSVPIPDRRGRHGNRANAYSVASVDHVRRQLSQHCKKGSKLLELSYKKCYQSYVEVYCVDHAISPVSFDKYRCTAVTERFRPRTRLTGSKKPTRRRKVTNHVASQTVEG